jgi:hypothetical protein
VCFFPFFPFNLRVIVQFILFLFYNPVHSKFVYCQGCEMRIVFSRLNKPEILTVRLKVH